jgi:hypothetical protein
MTLFWHVLRKTTVLLILSALTICVVHAEEGSKNEVGLLLGATVTPTRTLSGQAAVVEFGSGLVFQATYARQLSDFRGAALFFDLPFVASPLVGLSSSNLSVPANYAFLFVTPGLRLKVRPHSAVTPWVSLGGGYGFFEESKERQDGTAISRINAGRGAVQFGGGVDFRTPIKVLFPLGFRAEVRDFYSGTPDFRATASGGMQHNLVLSGGLVVRF